MIPMEMRREPRFNVNQPVTVTWINEGLTMDGNILNLSGNGLRVMLDRRVPPGTALKVEWGDTLLLCEVCYCQKRGERFFAGIQVEHALFETRRLAGLTRDFLGEPSSRVA